MGTTFSPRTTIRSSELNANFDEKLNKVRTITNVTASGGTTTMTNASDVIYIQGSTTQTVQLPDATTCYLGQRFSIINWTSGYFVTVNNSIGGLWDTIYYDTTLEVICVDTSIQNGWRTSIAPNTQDITVRSVETINGRIFFPSSQNASTNVNCLDDYEEGTFTPTVWGGSSSGTSTYVSQSGNYVKIGQLVFFTLNVEISNQTGTGNVRIGGLPFTSQSGIASYVSAITQNFLYVTTTASLAARVDASSTWVALTHPINNAVLQSSVMDTAFTVWASGCYRAST